MRLQILGWESNGLRCADSKIDLESGGIKKLNLIQMPNGTGKTTTLGLIQAAMTGDANTWSPKKIQKYKSRNKDNEQGKFTLHLQIDDNRLSFDLTIDFEQNEVIYRTSSSKIGGAVEGWKPPSEYRRFLVKSFVGLFIFDGELSKKLLDENETQAEKAIDALCQLYLLDEVINKLDAIWDRAVDKTEAKTTQGLKMWQNKFSTLNTQKDFLDTKKTESEKEILTLKTQIKDLSDSIDERLAAEGGKLEEMEAAKIKASNAENQVETDAESLMRDLRQPHLVDALFSESLKTLKDSMVELQIPRETSKQFFVEVAKSPSCICGEPMNELRKALILERSEKYLGSDITGELNALKTDIENHTANIDSSKNFVDSSASVLQKSIDESLIANTEIATLKAALTEGMDESIKKDKEDLDILKENKKGLEDLLEMLNEDDDGIDDVKSYSIASIKRQYKKAKDKISEISDNVALSKQIDLVKDILSRATIDSRLKITTQIVNECNTLLEEIMKLNPVTIRNINKSLQLEGQDGASTGQTLAVGYCFLSTLLNRGENKFPFVVDSPANPLDPLVRAEIATMIPRLCDQMIAFVIPPERPDFIPPLVLASDNDVRYITTFRINKGSQNLLDSLPDDEKLVEKTDDGVLVYGEEYFNHFLKEQE